MNSRALLLGALCSLAIVRGTASESPSDDSGRTHVVLVGATGDLAKRYLWPSLLKLHRKGQLGRDVRIFGAATSAPAEADRWPFGSPIRLATIWYCSKPRSVPSSRGMSTPAPR